MSFENFNLCKALLKGISDLGFTQSTPIQRKAIPEIISGEKDLIGLAQTGTGKTAAFGLPLIQLVDFNSRATKGLVLCPTRELCLQISRDLKSYSTHVKGAKIVSVYGGACFRDQIREVKSGAPIIIATPGRLIDLIERKVVDLSQVSYVVLDEADEMLSMGFLEDIDDILKHTSPHRKTWLFSATMPHAIAGIAAKYMKKPVEITAGEKNAVAGNIDHLHYIVREKDRYAALKRIIDFHPGIFGLIFCRTKNETSEVAENLINDGYQAEAIHGDLSQPRRDYVMRQFRERRIQLLVATDVAARGIDIENISHIIHFRLPDDGENYTHRSGRTARAGKSGMAITLINIKEKGKIAQIERKTGIRFRYEKIPLGRDILEKHLCATVDRLTQLTENQTDMEKFLPIISEKLASLTREDLIRRIISTECDRFFTYYKNSPDINIEKENRGSEKKAGDKKGSRIKEGNQRFFINVGEMDNVQKKSISKLICHHSGMPSYQLGKIEIYRSFSFFEVPRGSAENVLSSLKGVKLGNRKVQVEFAEERYAKTKKPNKKASVKR